MKPPRNEREGLPKFALAVLPHPINSMEISIIISNDARKQSISGPFGIHMQIGIRAKMFA